ncbi:hypothetical protein [Phaeobacter inhibens]|uniref:hypothetical protein n=1 Tax=Phaeobacter inhibens TaxID=221822 RepID=UPI0021A4576A|nr:hypothetical protein [Phaeobacter inhibens]UWR48929.1 hypothetical protein K4F87_16815 [Phaeobacter inhibens]
MFITHELSPLEMLSELVNLEGVSSADTKRFAELQHDKHLCPGFRDRVEAVLDAYKSHRNDVQDTQGMRDEGVDVQLRYHQDGDHRIGLQIKSHKEILDWKEKRDSNFVMRLKAQIAAAVANADIDYYYVLLCTDEVAHTRQIRFICSELKQFDKVRIVRPRQALTFFELDDTWISTFVAQILCKSDPLLDAARHQASSMEDDYAFLLLTLMCMACEGERVVTDERLSEIFDEGADLSPTAATANERLPEILWQLDGSGFNFSTADRDGLTIADFPTSWTALYFDQRHRHGEDIRDRLAMLLGIWPGSPKRKR